MAEMTAEVATVTNVHGVPIVSTEMPATVANMSTDVSELPTMAEMTAEVATMTNVHGVTTVSTEMPATVANVSAVAKVPTVTPTVSTMTAAMTVLGERFTWARRPSD